MHGFDFMILTLPNFKQKTKKFFLIVDIFLFFSFFVITELMNLPFFICRNLQINQICGVLEFYYGKFIHLEEYPILEL